MGRRREKKKKKKFLKKEIASAGVGVGRDGQYWKRCWPVLVGSRVGGRLRWG